MSSPLTTHISTSWRVQGWQCPLTALSEAQGKIKFVALALHSPRCSDTAQRNRKIWLTRIHDSVKLDFRNQSNQQVKHRSFSRSGAGAGLTAADGQGAAPLPVGQALGLGRPFQAVPGAARELGHVVQVELSPLGQAVGGVAGVAARDGCN